MIQRGVVQRLLRYQLLQPAGLILQGLNRCASETPNPPYFAFHRYSVCWLMPCLRHSSSV